MSWLRVDDRFDTHAKILMLGDGIRGDARRWTWTRVLLFTSRHESPDVPANISETIPRASKAFLKDCREIQLLDTEDGKMVVHDWLIYADVDLAAKVTYCLRKAPHATANDIARVLPSNRQAVLAEVKRQRGGREEPPWDDLPLVPRNHPKQPEGWFLPDPTLPDPDSGGSPSPSTVPFPVLAAVGADSSPLGKLCRACRIDDMESEDAQKLARAMRGLPESDVADIAYSAPKGVRDRLAWTLSELKKRRVA